MRNALVSIAMVACLVVAGPGLSDAAKPLTNQDVVEMVKAGLPEGTILLSIQQSPAKFSTAPQELIALKKAGVPPSIMDAMVTHGSGAASATRGASAVPQTDGGLIPTAYGSYAVTNGKLISLPLTPVDLVFGLRIADRGVAVDGFKPNANATVLEDPSVSFVLYSHELNPAEFKFARLELLETLQTGQFNIQGTDPRFFKGVWGVSPNQTVVVNLLRPKEFIGLKVEPVVGRTDMYRLVPQQPLRRGQSYALYAKDGLRPGDSIFTASPGQAPSYGIFIKTTAGDVSQATTEPMPPPAPSAGAATASAAEQSAGGVTTASSLPPKMAGSWSGRIEGGLGGLVGYFARVELQTSAGGAVSGVAEYRPPPTVRSDLLCRTSLNLVTVEGNQYTFEETISETHAGCPVTGMVRFTKLDAGRLEGHWCRADSPSKIRIKGVLGRTQ